MSPYFSIIIPVYNAEQTLNICISSILKQEFRDFELILIDDGSKDLSCDICKSYSLTDTRIIFICQQNKGVSAARNAGLDIAQGKWIAFVDSDDYVEQGFLQQLPAQSDIVMGCMKDQYDDGSIRDTCIIQGKKDVKEDNLRVYLERYISSMLFRSPCGKFYKRELIGSYRFKEDMKVAEDACFVMHYLYRINMITLMPTGAYIVRLSQIPANTKYKTTVETAVRSLNYLFEVYMLNAKKYKLSILPFFSFINYFKYISMHYWKQEPSLWYGNREIRKMYRYVWPDLSWKQKVKLLGSFILRK